MDPRNLQLLLLLFCLVFLHAASASAGKDVAESEESGSVVSRKQLGWVQYSYEMEAKKKKGLGLGFNEELRTVPSGPDPLHHNVNPPKQPTTHSHHFP